MSETKHTPGPWKISDGAILCQNVNAYGNFHIARFDRGDSDNTGEDLANARLIAAAPELLAALKDTLCLAEAYFDTLPDDGEAQDHYMTCVIELARNAIAKAEGREE